MTAEPKTTKAKLMIVEDEVAIAQDLKARLEDLGHDVIACVTTGEEALQLIVGCPPDIVLMDIILSGQADGIDVAESIRSNYGIPVVFITAYVDAERFGRAKLTYPFGYILKPFQEQDLRITIEMALYVGKVDTERRQAEEALRESEEKYRSLYEETSDGIFLGDDEATLYDANPAILRMLGYTIDEIKGETLYEFFHPDDLKEKPHQLQAVLSGEITHAERPLRKKDGTYTTFETTGIRIEKNRIMGIFRDITDRKQSEEVLRESEERHRRLVEFLPTGVLIHSGGEILFVNDTLVKLLGAENADQLLGKPVIELVHPDYVEAAMKRFDIYKVNPGVTTSPPIQEKILKLDGSAIDIESSTIPFQYFGKSARLSVVQDISKQKQTEEQIRVSLKEKEALLHEVHHRVKNNMQVISSLLSLKRRRIENEAAREAFTESESQIGAMALIHETLYQTETFEAVDLEQYCHRLLDLVFQAYPTSNNNIGFKDDIKQVQISLDQAVPCGLVLNEIFTNSLKYAFPGEEPGEIYVNGKTLSDGSIQLDVGDNGVGLPEGIDWRNHDTMGLPLVASLIEGQLKGQLDLKVDKGTHFTITFNQPKQ